MAINGKHAHFYCYFTLATFLIWALRTAWHHDTRPLKKTMKGLRDLRICKYAFPIPAQLRLRICFRKALFLSDEFRIHVCHNCAKKHYKDAEPAWLWDLVDWWWFTLKLNTARNRMQFVCIKHIHFRVCVYAIQFGI